jgi:hypothetical protein
MQEPDVTHVELGEYLDSRVDEGLEVLNKRNPGLDWKREQLIRLTVGYGLDRLFRRYLRKHVHLSGVYQRIYPPGSQEAIAVKNLSSGGLMFRTIGPNSIRVNEVLRVSFSLKEISVSIIVIVKYAVGHEIGVEFCEPEDNRRLEAYITGLP